VQEAEIVERALEAVEHAVEHDTTRQKPEAKIAAGMPDLMKQWDWAAQKQDRG